MDKSGQIFIDPSTIRKNTIVRDGLRLIDNVPVFSLLEFNIHGSCTRSCSFCPISDKSFWTKTQDALDPALFEKILTDLSDIEFDGKILFSAFSEPLLHKRLEELFALKKRILPKARMEIVTNGDLFSVEKLKKMFEAGLDVASVSVYDGPEATEKFRKMGQEAGLSEEQLILRRRYYDEGNYGMTISNRAGVVDSNKYRDENEQQVTELPLKLPCFYPFYMFLVDYNGESLLCPHDWTKSVKAGNLRENHIWEVWKGSVFEAVRKKLARADRGFTPCATCDVRGNVIGKESFTTWVKSWKA